MTNQTALGCSLGEDAGAPRGAFAQAGDRSNLARMPCAADAIGRAAHNDYPARRRRAARLRGIGENKRDMRRVLIGGELFSETVGGYHVQP